MRNRARVLITGLAVLTLLLAAMGCRASGTTLEGTSWQLVAWTVSSMDPTDYTITASFADGRISGTSAVNSYSGPFTLGPGDAFATGDLVTTLMAGPEPAMRAEQAYLELLRQARAFSLAGTTLTLYDEGGNQSLIFEAVTN